MVPAVFPQDLVDLPALVNACYAQLGDLTMAYGLGLHPYALAAHPEAEDEHHLAALEHAVEHAQDPRLKAVGECGLHFLEHAGRAPIDRGRQIAVTRRQLELSRRTGLPAILHCVRAHGPLLELLDERPTPASVLHSFTGSAALALEYTRRGHYVSFSPSILSADARKSIEAARVVPGAHLLIETDSPDQTPESLRPAINEPANVRLVAEKLAAVRGTDLETIAATTYENARRVFRMEDELP